MMWLKKKLFCMLLLLSLSFCYAQQSQLDFTKINTTNLFQNIDNSLSSLEAEQSNMKAFIDRQGKQIENLENAYQNQLQLYLDLDCKYQKSKQDLKKWKTCSVVLGTTTVTFGVATTILIAVMVNK